MEHLVRREIVKAAKARKVASDSEKTAEEGSQKLSFTSRQVPLTPATRGGLLVFLIFLASFTAITVMERNDHVYYFAEHARLLVGSGTFHELESHRLSSQEYKAWFAFHFVDGLANVSTRLDRERATVVMVGPPRVRQVRYSANCSVPSEMHLLVPVCADQNIESRLPFGRQPKNGKPYRYQSAKETGDTGHAGEMHKVYSGAGFLLPMHQYLTRPMTVRVSGGNELYPYSYWSANVTDLWESGWIDQHTKAIFHDFTLYSSSLDLYANLRLTTEFEGNGGHMMTHVNLRTFYLQRDMMFMGVQYTFALFLLILIFGELGELRQGWFAAEKVLVERCVELKYDLRLKTLQFGAEHGVPSMYRPMQVLKTLVHRLYRVDSRCTHHIEKLNAIGEAIPKLQTHFDDSMLMLKATGFTTSAKVYKENVVVKSRLDRTTEDLALLRDPNGNCIRKSWTKTKAAVSFYYQNEWNLLDSINYLLLFVSFLARVYSWSLMEAHRDSVANITRPTSTGSEPWRDEEFVSFFTIGVASASSFFLNALSAILTWLKVFKFLSFFPAMSIFTKTVAFSAQHLGVFLVVLMVRHLEPKQ